MEFAEQILVKNLIRPVDLFLFSVFLHQRTVHFGQEYQKRWLSRCYSKVCKAEIADTDVIVLLLEPADNSLLSAVEVLRCEVRASIEIALQRLKSEQQELFTLIMYCRRLQQR